MNSLLDNEKKRLYVFFALNCRKDRFAKAHAIAELGALRQPAPGSAALGYACSVARSLKVRLPIPGKATSSPCPFRRTLLSGSMVECSFGSEPGPGTLR